MTIKVGMVSLGCSKNQVDAEMMMSKISQDGYELCPDQSICDVVIINTCGFIESAKKESIDTIFEFCQLKENGNVKVVVITGCLAERYQQDIADEIPEADVILGIGSNDKISEAIRDALDGKRVVKFGDKTDLSLDGERILANSPYFAYLKVADGCDNFCTYCAIPSIRGRFRSRTMENIIEEAKLLASRGVRELNVVAQDTTRYGEDIYGKCMLIPLVKELVKIKDIKWIRLLYCYPERVTDELLELMNDEPKIVKYFDLPLQHCNKNILKRMNRFGDYVSLIELLNKIRDKVKGVCLRTTLIAGFPGETDEDINELCQFIKDVKFERLGCFAYSQEEGTPAAKMPNQIQEEDKISRADLIMREQMNIAMEISQGCIGKVLDVLVEGYDVDQKLHYGRSYMDAPDIDTKTFFSSNKTIASGTFVTVKVIDSDGYDMVGKLIRIEGEEIESTQ